MSATVGKLKSIVMFAASFVLALGSVSFAAPQFFNQIAYATPVTEIAISSVPQLCDAINNQAAGQTWTIASGVYGLNQCNSISAGGQTGWYMPITANDITINGVGNPTIYGDSYSANGNWATQDLVAIFGNNVTLNGLTLMPKVEPNKTIEIIGDSATIKNVTITPNTLTNQSDYNNISDPSDLAWKDYAKTWGGSIYYNNATGTQVLDNVSINNGGVSVHAPGTTFNINSLQLTYASDVDWINDYRFYVASPTSVINGAPTYTYHVNSTLNNFDSVLAAVGDPTTVQGTETISLDSDITTTKQITLTKAVTLNGNGHTVSPHFTKNGNDNNSALGIQANNITVNNLVENGTNGVSLHGVNVFSATGVNLNNVTVENNAYNGLVVNGSGVTVNNLTTSNNGWGGVNVDKVGAVLTVNGTSHHTGEVADIYVDNASIGQVIDTNSQYSITHPVVQANDSAYNLKPAAPTLTYPTNNSFINTNDFWFNWNDVSGAASYEFQTSQSPSTDGSGSLNTGVWTGDYQHNQPTASTLHSVGASGTWYWQVRAVDAKGAKSNWSSVWTMSIDMTKPSTPTITNPTAEQHFNTTPILDKWNPSNDNLSGINHYQIAYRYDDTHTFGSSTCPSLTIPGYSGFIGCRDVVGTERDHAPAANEQGGVTIWVRAIDNAGNVGDWSTPVHYVYDATAPTGLANLSPVDGAYVTTAGQLSIDWTDASDSSAPVSYYYQSSLSSATNPDGSFVSPVYTSGALSSSTIPTTNTPEGVYYWHVRAVDTAGNSTGWTTPWKVTVDNTAPGSTNNLAPLVNGTVTIQQHVTDNFAAKSGKLRIWKLTSGGVADNSKFFAIGDLAVDGTNSVTYNLNTVANLFGDGNYIAKFTSTDQSGNASVAQVNFRVDNTGPTVTIANTPSLITSGSVTPIVTATDASEPLKYLWMADSTNPAVMSFADTIAQPTFTPAVAGTYSFTLVATDVLGNPTTKTFGFTYTPPVVTNNGTTLGTIAVTPQPTNNTFAAPAVLGTETNTEQTPATDTLGTPEVQGASDQATASTSTPSSSSTGLAWYWWVLIVAAVISFGWWLAAKLRNRSNEA